MDITITPINNAPLAGDIQQTTPEHTALVVDPLAQASDLDSPVLTPPKMGQFHYSRIVMRRSKVR